eukprot:4281075-Ditylum_brightwellii.AAC.1
MHSWYCSVHFFFKKEQCSPVQDRTRAVCNILPWRYGAPCCANANSYRILRLHTALRAALSTPPFRGVLNTSSTPPSGGTSIFSTQPYQGGRIVYVMCNPTALV